MKKWEPILGRQAQKIPPLYSYSSIFSSFFLWRWIDVWKINIEKKIVTLVLVMAAMVARQIKEKDTKQETKVSYLGYKFAYFAACLMFIENVEYHIQL